MKPLRFSPRIVVAIVAAAVVSLGGLSLAYGSPIAKKWRGHGHSSEALLPETCGKFLRGAEATGQQIDPDSYAYRQPSNLVVPLKAGNRCMRPLIRIRRIRNRSGCPAESRGSTTRAGTTSGSPTTSSPNGNFDRVTSTWVFSGAAPVRGRPTAIRRSTPCVSRATDMEITTTTRSRLRGAPTRRVPAHFSA
jgi:hypothetical protein